MANGGILNNVLDVDILYNILGSDIFVPNDPVSLITYATSLSKIQCVNRDTIYELIALNLVNVDQGITILSNLILGTISFPLLVSATGSLTVTGNNILSQLYLPSLTTIGGGVNIEGLSNNPIDVDLSNLQFVDNGMTLNYLSQTTLDLGSLQDINSIVIYNSTFSNNIDLSNLSICGYVEMQNVFVGGFVDLSGLTNSSALSFTTVVADTIDLLNLIYLGDTLQIVSNSEIPSMDVDGLTINNFFSYSSNIFDNSIHNYVLIYSPQTIINQNTFTSGTFSMNVNTGGSIQLNNNSDLHLISVSFSQVDTLLIQQNTLDTLDNIHFGDVTTNIQISDNSGLVNVDLSYIDSNPGFQFTGNGSVESLDISGITHSNYTVEIGGNVSLESLDVSGLIEAATVIVAGNDNMATPWTVDLSNLVTTQNLQISDNYYVTSALVTDLTTVDQDILISGANLTSMNFPSLISAEDIRCLSLTYLNLPVLTTGNVIVGDNSNPGSPNNVYIQNSSYLESATMSGLTSSNEIMLVGNTYLKSIDLSSLIDVTNGDFIVQDNPELITLNLGNFVDAIQSLFIADNPLLVNLNLNSFVGSPASGGLNIDNNDSLLYLNLTSMDEVNGLNINNNDSIISVTSSVSEINFGGIVNNSDLVSISLDNLSNIITNFNIGDNGSLTSISLNSLTSIVNGYLSISNLPVITTLDFSDITTLQNGLYGLGSLRLLGYFPLVTTVNLSNLVSTNTGNVLICNDSDSLMPNLTTVLVNNGLDALYVTVKSAALTATSVNNILIALDTAGNMNGEVYLNDGTSAAPTGGGIIAKANLIGKGWVVATN